MGTNRLRMLIDMAFTRSSEKIFDIANVPPVLKNTFRYARPGEMFLTNTLLRRIENAETLKEQRENSI